MTEPTYQAKLEAERVDLAVDTMIVAPKNSARVHMILGTPMLIAASVSACVSVTLDRAALRLLAADIAEAERCLKAQPVDDEIEPSPDTLPSTPTSISSAPPPADERIDEIRGAT